MQASRAVAERFHSGAQLILRVADRTGDPAEQRARVTLLTRDLLAIDGVEGAYSIATDDPETSPLFERVLLTPDPAATNVVLQVGETDPEELLPRVETVVDGHRSADTEIVISGVPAIVEMIRRSLFRDLVVFSAAAALVFALLIGGVYRDPAIVVGTLSTCFVAVAGTLLAVQAMSVGIGLLTANLVTIVFVLTLSHVVFMTANWRRAVAESDPAEGVADETRRASWLGRALHDTWEGSFWSMATTLLGFASLLVATARPLRELGIAGIVGALAALGAAYVVYPAFLGRWASASVRGAIAIRDVRPTRGLWLLPVAGVVVLAIGSGVPRVDTDPGLLTYFAEGSELRRGLARIDADGGSSTLDIVVADPDGRAVSSPEVFPRLERLQAALEADSAVGVVLSPVVLIEHARTVPLARLLPVGMLLDLASTDALGGVGLGFVTPDRGLGRFSLRMRESGGPERERVIARLRGEVESVGLEAVVVAGLYDLQAQLGRLIASSLKIGIGGLLVLFLAVAFVVSRSGPIALAMWACLAAIPVVILGAFGHAGVAVDIITSPAANIALAVGADSMIHLVVRLRRLEVPDRHTRWATAVAQVGRPVLGASAIICAGFGIFALSSFPPTQRFGFAVIVGTVTAATMALLVLPRLACLGADSTDSLSGPETPNP